MEHAFNAYKLWHYIRWRKGVLSTPPNFHMLRSSL
nr:MAG TPA: hypothetical protein [Bacteriophage sp.]